MLFQEQIRLLLGRDRYISTSVYNGENLVHLRKFADEEWKTLEGQKAEYLVHLGYGTFLKVYLYNGLRYYDVRRYWRPPTQYDAVPTKTGLNMNKTEFEKLRSVREAMFTALPQLHDVSACDCITQGNELASFHCVECISQP